MNTEENLNTEIQQDLFPWFETKIVSIGDVDYFMRMGGGRTAPPLLLLHGFPQTHAIWHHIAPELSKKYRVICLDLKGYGATSVSDGGDRSIGYSKRNMGKDCIEIMNSLGYDKFSVIGHDRGALIGYRLALDIPERITSLAILDNLPTFVLWEWIESDPAFIPHWRKMAQPSPLAEAYLTEENISIMVTGHNEDFAIDMFNPRAMAQYRASWINPAKVYAFAEDYRAGAGIDLEHDLEDFHHGKKITCPAIVIWGKDFLGSLGEDPLSVWKRTFIPGCIGKEVPGGHFVAEESPLEVLNALQGFLQQIK
ncbi:alpha/beta fold hydrolase [Pedobacter sp. 22163]|uniref:alpha/beta fold hydrolase n=1 Tax=Pedobacter sp. 22163 TaxID=3453883 RepID=UPI003F861ECC